MVRDDSFSASAARRLAAMTGWLPRLWRQPSAVLLAVQLIGVLLYPFMDESPIGRATLSLFGLIVLFLAVRAVRATPALTVIAVLLGIPHRADHPRGRRSTQHAGRPLVF